MKEELEFKYDVLIGVSHLDQNGTLKPSSYQILLNNIADQHLAHLGLNVDTTSEFNLAWVLTSFTVEIEIPITSTMLLSGSTWHASRKGPFFRREFVFKNECGEVMFKGASYSVLLDTVERTIYRKKELPFPLGEETNILLVEASPNLKANILFINEMDVRVQNSYIDALGHVNNCKYGDFAHDALSPQECERLRNLKKMEIYFSKELTTGDNFCLQKGYDENKIFVRGDNLSKQNTAFTTVFTF